MGDKSARLSGDTVIEIFKFSLLEAKQWLEECVLEWLTRAKPSLWVELQGKILDSWRDDKSHARKERASKLSMILPKAWRLDPASASQIKPSLSLSPFFLPCSEFLEFSSCSNHQLASGRTGPVRSEARSQHHLLLGVCLPHSLPCWGHRALQVGKSPGFVCSSSWPGVLWLHYSHPRPFCSVLCLLLLLCLENSMISLRFHPNGRILFF